MYNVAAHDMSWDEATQSTGFWEGMVYNHTDIGGYFGTKAIQQTDMYKEYQAAQEKARKEREKAKEKEADQTSDDAKDDPVNTADTLLGGLWYSLKKAGEFVEDIFESMGNWISGDGFVSVKLTHSFPLNLQQ